MDRNFRLQNMQDDWLVSMLVAFIKFWIFVGFAFVKAAFIVMEDPETANNIRNLLDRINEGMIEIVEQQPHSPSTSNATVFSHETDHRLHTTQVQLSEEVAEREFYAITTGLDVGITERRAIAHNLTFGVPQASIRSFDCREDANAYYLSSLQAGTVHRIRSCTLPTAQIQRHTETISADGGVRDLDICLALGGASVMRELHGGLSSSTAHSNRRVSPIQDGSDSDGLVMPDDWLVTRMPCPTSTPVSSDGFICPTSTPVSSNGLVCVTRADIGRVIVLTDDEDESETSQQVQGEGSALDMAEVSSHSSDRYYSSDLDIAIQEVIEEEDKLIASGSCN